MKKRISVALIIVGMAILLGGLLTYGLGVHALAPVSRPDLIVAGTSVIGILLTVMGACDLLIKRDRAMEIEEKDERNVAIANAAMASGFKAMSAAFSVVLFALIYTGYLTVVPCFALIGAFLVGQCIFLTRLVRLQKTM